MKKKYDAKTNLKLTEGQLSRAEIEIIFREAGWLRFQDNKGNECFGLRLQDGTHFLASDETELNKPTDINQITLRHYIKTDVPSNEPSVLTWSQVFETTTMYEQIKEGVDYEKEI